MAWDHSFALPGLQDSNPGWYVEMRMNDCLISSLGGLMPLQNNAEDVVWQNTLRTPDGSPELAALSAEKESSLVRREQMHTRELAPWEFPLNKCLS